MDQTIKNNLTTSRDLISNILDDNNFFSLYKNVLKKLIHSLKNGNSVYIAGNGGSASQANHFAGELVGRFYISGKSLKVYSLNANTAIITCIANDFSYEEVFSQQLSGQLKKGDIFIGLSTSGKSKNIINAIKLCNKLNCTSVLISGKSNNDLNLNNCISLIVPSKITPTIQEIHLVILHSLAEDIEKALRVEN